MSIDLQALALPTLSSAAPPAKNTKLHDAAQQFEALLVGQMLKSARDESSDGWLGSGGSTGDDSALSMAESQLANALTQHGGLGLARVIEQSMANRSAQNISETPAKA